MLFQVNFAFAVFHCSHGHPIEQGYLKEQVKYIQDREHAKKILNEGFHCAGEGCSAKLSIKQVTESLGFQNEVLTELEKRLVGAASLCSSPTAHLRSLSSPSSFPMSLSSSSSSSLRSSSYESQPSSVRRNIVNPSIPSSIDEFLQVLPHLKTEDALQLIQKQNAYSSKIQQMAHKAKNYFTGKTGPLLYQADKEGQTLLMGAALSSDHKVVKLLLDKKLNPKIENDDGHTALRLTLMKIDGIMFAADLNSSENIRKLANGYYPFITLEDVVRWIKNVETLMNHPSSYISRSDKTAIQKKLDGYKKYLDPSKF